MRSSSYLDAHKFCIEAERKYNSTAILPTIDELVSFAKEDQRAKYIGVNRSPRLGIIVSATPAAATLAYHTLFGDKPHSVEDKQKDSEKHSSELDKQFYSILLFVKGKISRDGKIVSSFKSFRKAKEVIEELMLAYPNFSYETHIQEDKKCTIFIWPKNSNSK